MTHEIKAGQHGEGCECPNCHNRPYAHWKETDQTKCETLRKKKPSFQPQYYSGLNWRDAEKLVGKTVYCSDNAENWVTGKLTSLGCNDEKKFRIDNEDCWAFIKTRPRTHKHPIITIAGGWKLARPETKALDKGKEYYVWRPDGLCKYTWDGSPVDYYLLEKSIVHLTEDRAQAWADWWDEIVIKAVNK